MQFHTPAEHTFNGEDPYDVELEIYYQTSEGDMAIVSVFFSLGPLDRIRFRSPLFDDLHLDEPGKGNMTVDEIDLSETFGDLDMSSLWQYEGSLTTPPCSRNVQWFLFNSPLSITSD
jgi:carbonic anhydrase